MEKKTYTRMALRRHGVVTQVTLGMAGSGDDRMAMMMGTGGIGMGMDDDD